MSGDACTVLQDVTTIALRLPIRSVRLCTVSLQSSCVKVTSSVENELKLKRFNYFYIILFFIKILYFQLFFPRNNCCICFTYSELENNCTYSCVTVTTSIGLSLLKYNRVITQRVVQLYHVSSLVILGPSLASISRNIAGSSSTLTIFFKSRDIFVT